MRCRGPVVTKFLLNCMRPAERKTFLSEIQKLVRDCYQPTLVLDLSGATNIGPDAIELLLRCVELIHRADGRVLLTAVPPEAAVVLEVTRLNTVASVLSVSAQSAIHLPELGNPGVEHAA